MPSPPAAGRPRWADVPLHTFEAVTPYLTVTGAQNAFAVTSGSEAWNLAGVQAALAIAGPRAAAEL